MKPNYEKPTLENIKTFIGLNTLGVGGVSRDPKKFGNIVFKELVRCGYQVFPINHNADEVDGYKCYHSVVDLPDGIKALVLVTPPEQSLILMRQAADKGIRYYWLQQGSESHEVIEFGKANDLKIISGHCILMFLEPVKGIHKVHRFFSKFFGFYPK